ncbi:MAG: efflux RND transporter periplasmic adaptor subunit, partial [Terriglobales bacterium]
MLAGLALAASILAVATWLKPRMSTPDVAEMQAPAPDAARKETSPTPQQLQLEDAVPARAAPAGPVNTVELSQEEEKAIGVRTAQVKRRKAGRTLMTVGRIEEAETRLATISARVGGRIDRLFVDFTGQNVRRGQPIAEIYSPEVVSSAEEYRLALENLERLGAATPQAAEQARELVTASRRRLELWGLTPEQVREIEKAEQVKVHVTIHSPVSGIVTERAVTEGQYVREGDALYRVTDLGLVWVKADVYESDLPGVRVGQRAEITSDALPGEKLTGRISFIDPMVKPETRTVSV